MNLHLKTIATGTNSYKLIFSYAMQIVAMDWFIPLEVCIANISRFYVCIIDIFYIYFDINFRNGTAEDLGQDLNQTADTLLESE